MAIDLGGTYALGVAIRNTAGTLVNPSTITLTITLPDATTVSPTPTNDSTGLYSYQYTTSQEGRHLARWVTTNPVTAYTDVFDVEAAEPRTIVSLQDVKDFLNITAADVAADTTLEQELRSFITALTPVVENITGPVVRRSVTSTMYPTCANWKMPLPHYPVISITSAADVWTGAAIDTTNWYVDNGVLRTKNFYPLAFLPFTVTYVIGCPTLPDNIRLGALHVLKLAWRTQRGNNPDSFMPALVMNAAREWFAPNEQFGFA